MLHTLFWLSLFLMSAIALYFLAPYALMFGEGSRPGEYMTRILPILAVLYPLSVGAYSGYRLYKEFSS